ncbi:hypothetical protein A6J80_03090 [Paracoccus yeei]|uniref:Uncharacterized protein n=1 Tax=Paracoccus yeei TaxID=147645 RepID=A0A1V0GP76_9RHOB|nr:hypothetical protein [Paracoccus yeei]ARC35499.1 hypothetical protein A6J80_03090 [Paracoccus yeei]
MTDAELIARLRDDVKVHEMTGDGGMGRVEATRLAADRLTQLSEENARLRSLMVEAKQRLSYDADIFHDQVLDQLRHEPVRSATV